jgi:glucose/arabinose dehydrogenase
VSFGRLNPSFVLGPYIVVELEIPRTTYQSAANRNPTIMVRGILQTALGLLLASRCLGQTTTSSASGSCPTVLTPKSGPPVVASGYSAQLIANGLKSPRGIIFDKSGALLVVQQNVGIVRLAWTDLGGTCINVANQTTVVTNSGLNHGIEFSPDGKTLYASSTEAVYSWPYDPTSGMVTGNSTQLVKNMTNTDHSTRTLLLSKKYPELLLVSRGSSENIDPIALEKDSGHSFIKAFNLSERGDTVWNYPTDGKLLGWGLRNDVGVAEHPVTGGIWSVENSADDIERQGTDIHLENPAEELNFLGYLNGSTEDQGGNYGYPNCYAIWNTTDFPSVGSLQVGDQFALNPNASLNDTTCNDNYVAPRLVFLAHTAPLDIKFTPDGSLAYVTFHGSCMSSLPLCLSPSSVKMCCLKSDTNLLLPNRGSSATVGL